MDNFGRIKFEPIVNGCNEVFAYEMLTNSASLDHLDFNHLSEEDKFYIFKEQLEVVKDIKNKGAGGFLFSVNITMNTAKKVIHKKNILNALSSLSDVLRLEICEDFKFGEKEEVKNILRILSNVCPLWIDDFSDDWFSLDVFYDVNFEYIKIDKDFYWRYSENIIVLSLVLYFCKQFSIGAIVEGVDSIERYDLAKFIGFSGFQGYLWKDVNMT